MRPVSTGQGTAVNTIGIVLVARATATAVGPVIAQMTSTPLANQFLGPRGIPFGLDVGEGTRDDQILSFDPPSRLQLGAQNPHKKPLRTLSRNRRQDAQRLGLRRGLGSRAPNTRPGDCAEGK